MSIIIDQLRAKMTRLIELRNQFEQSHDIKIYNPINKACNIIVGDITDIMLANPQAHADVNVNGVTYSIYSPKKTGHVTGFYSKYYINERWVVQSNFYAEDNNDYDSDEESDGWAEEDEMMFS